MTFNITFMLFVIIIILAAIVVAILAYPGPVDGAPKSAGRQTPPPRQN